MMMIDDAGHLIDLTPHEPETVAGLLKLWLRELPEPLLTWGLFNEFLTIGKPPVESTEADVVELAQSLVKRLPDANRVTLIEVMKLILDVVAHSDLNKMNAHNMAIVFGPTLLAAEVCYGCPCR